MSEFCHFGEIQAICEMFKEYQECEQIIYNFKASNLEIPNIWFVLRNVAKFINAHVFAKFRYVGKQAICSES